MNKRKLNIFDSLKTKDLFLIMLMIGIAIWAVYYRKICRPNLALIRDLQADIRKAEKKTCKIEGRIPQFYIKLENDLKKTQQDYDDLKKALDLFYTKIPSKSQMSELLTYLLAKDSKANKLEFIFVKADSTENKKFYQKAPLTFSLTGDYNRIIAYFKKIERLSVFSKIDKLEFQVNPDILPAINVDFTLIVFLQDSVGKKPLVLQQMSKRINLKHLLKKKWPDPFTAHMPRCLLAETASKLPLLKDLTLSGIIWSKDNPSAVINGTAIKTGDNIDGLQVLEIAKDKVILQRNNTIIKLELK